MKTKQLLLIAGLIGGILFLSLQACGSKNQATKLPATPVSSQGGRVQVFKAGRWYQVNKERCNKNLELFDYDSDGNLFTVPPHKLCDLDKPFIPGVDENGNVELRYGKVPKTGIRGFLGQEILLRFVRIHWEIEPGIFQEAFVEEIQALLGSESTQEK